MITRRQVLGHALAGTSALTAISAFGPALLSGRADAAASPVNTLLDAFFEEDVTRSPETATQLGLDSGAHKAARWHLDDRSPAGRARNAAAAADQLRRLTALDRSALHGLDAVSYDSVAYVLRQLSDAYARFDFGSLLEGSPYTVSQLTGSYSTVPTFLDTKHKVESKDDADAYLSRLEAFAQSLDADSQRLAADVGKGVIPPDFILDTTLSQLKALRTTPDEAGLVTSIARRAGEIKGAGHALGEAYGAKAAGIFKDKVLPALERQIAAVEAARAKATHDAGVWHNKDGAEWYAYGLAASTTTDLKPDEIHQMGLDQAAEITARMDEILKKQGLTQGGVGERLKALSTPEYLYPDTDAGKAQLIADLQTRLEVMTKALPRFFSTLPKAAMKVARVPKVIEDGAPLAYYDSASLDGKRPGTLYFNLFDTAEWPKWALPTTLYHEGVPGHHLQGSIAQETKGLPRYRANMFFSGYGEGWALYAEQLADELGAYDDFPLGRLGYLQAQLFRAGRLIVDTGLHHKRWTREQAVAKLVELTGQNASGITREVDRYCTWPGQACSYKIGHTTWNRLRDEAKAKLGAKFDIRDFHHAGLSAGVVPLAVLQTVVDTYIQQKLAG